MNIKKLKKEMCKKKEYLRLMITRIVNLIIKSYENDNRDSKVFATMYVLNKSVRLH